MDAFYVPTAWNGISKRVYIDYEHGATAWIRDLCCVIISRAIHQRPISSVPQSSRKFKHGIQTEFMRVFCPFFFIWRTTRPRLHWGRLRDQSMRHRGAIHVRSWFCIAENNIKLPSSQSAKGHVVRVGTDHQALYNIIMIIIIIKFEKKKPVD